MVSSRFYSCFNVKNVKGTAAISSILWRLILDFSVSLVAFNVHSIKQNNRTICWTYLFYFSSWYRKLKCGSVKLKVAFFQEVRKEFSTWCWSCKIFRGIFREIFRENRDATLKRGQICCNFTQLNHALNSSSVSKPRWLGFSTTGTSRRTRIRISSGNNGKGKDSYQHRRYRPRRLWQVNYNRPFDLQMRRNRQANNWKVRERSPRGKGSWCSMLRLPATLVFIAKQSNSLLKFYLAFPRLLSIFLPSTVLKRKTLINYDSVKEVPCKLTNQKKKGDCGRKLWVNRGNRAGGEGSRVGFGGRRQLMQPYQHTRCIPDSGAASVWSDQQLLISWLNCWHLFFSSCFMPAYNIRHNFANSISNCSSLPSTSSRKDQCQK